jgi:hypothetical protein
MFGRCVSSWTCFDIGLLWRPRRNSEEMKQVRYDSSSDRRPGTYSEAERRRGCDCRVPGKVGSLCES